MHNSFLYLFSFTIFLIIFSACGSDEFPWQKIDKQAYEDAESLSDEVRLAYLQCYPLDYQNKKACIQVLNDQYIKAEYKTNLQYQRSFQYKLEKLGFLKFLQDRNLTCLDIDHGPKFIKSANAYQVICTCSNIYFMQFDHIKEKWYIKN